MALPKCEGRITVATGGLTFVVTENPGPVVSTITIPAGDYYWNSTDLSVDFAQRIKTSMANGSPTLNGVYSVTVDSTSDLSTGKLTIALTVGATSFYISAWTSTTLRDWMGFSATTGTATTVTGSYHVRYLWLPNVGRSGIMAPEPLDTSLNLGAIESDQSYSESPDGRSVVLSFNERYVDTFSFSHLIGYKTWRATEVVRNESLQRFWHDVISPGRPFQYYPDRSDETRYFLEKIKDGKDFKPKPVRDNWQGTYAIYAIEYTMGEAVGE